MLAVWRCAFDHGMRPRIGRGISATEWGSVMLSVPHLQYVLDRQMHWITAADARSALVLPLSTAMLGSLALMAGKSAHWPVAAGWLVLMAALLLLGAISCCAIGAFPRMYDVKPSIVFFEGVASKSAAQYRDAVELADDAAFASELVQQCHANARIAAAKFKWVRRGMLCLLMSAIPWVIAVYSFYSC